MRRPPRESYSREGEETVRKLKLLIADDHGLMIEAVKLALEQEPDFEIVGEADCGSQLFPLVQRTEPDLVVLDLLMPGIDGLTCLRLLRERFPVVRTAVLSALDSEEAIEAALEAGAHAFILKSIEPAELPDALRRAAFAPVRQPIGRAEKRPGSAVAEAGLTEQELAVLRALAQGQSNKEIARSLWLSKHTVKFHLTNIYRKLTLRGRTEAVSWAYRNGLVETPSVSTPVAEQVRAAARPQPPPNPHFAHVGH
jgi:DNA-binding NarL/FixJ family response regulator